MHEPDAAANFTAYHVLRVFILTFSLFAPRLRRTNGITRFA